MKKKVLTIMLGAMMCLSMVGCGNDNVSTTTNEAASAEGEVADESVTTGINSGDVDSEGQNEVTSNDDEKVSSDIITIDICGVKFNLGDEWEPIREQLEAKGFDFTENEKAGIYRIDADHNATFTYSKREVDGKILISKVDYILPIEAYMGDKDFQENMVKFNGYNVLETEEFMTAHNSQDFVVTEVEGYKDCYEIDTGNCYIEIGNNKNFSISLK